MRYFSILFLALATFAQADEFHIKNTTGFDEIVRLHKTGEVLTFGEVSNFVSGHCYSVNAKAEAFPTVLVSKTQEIFGEQTTKMAFYFLPEGVTEVAPDSPMALELLTFLEDDWRFWSPVKEEDGLHFFYDIEDNGRLDAKIELVQSGAEVLLTYRNLIGQKLTFMGETFRSSRNQLIGACSFGGQQ